MLLCDLPLRRRASIREVVNAENTELISRRLQDIGFVVGESVEIVARAPWGGDPVLVQVVGTRFALRRNEARLIVVEASK